MEPILDSKQMQYDKFLIELSKYVKPEQVPVVIFIGDNHKVKVYDNLVYAESEHEHLYKFDSRKEAIDTAWKFHLELKGDSNVHSVRNGSYTADDAVEAYELLTNLDYMEIHTSVTEEAITQMSAVLHNDGTMQYFTYFEPYSDSVEPRLLVTTSAKKATDDFLHKTTIHL